MPITQARMIRLITAADSARGKLAALRDLCARLAAAPDAEAALGDLAAAIATPHFCLANADAECIVEERTHFRHVEHRNNRTAVRQRRKRGKPAPGDEAFSIRAEGPSFAAEGGATDDAGDDDTLDMGAGTAPPT